MDVDRYLRRMDVDPATVGEPSHDSLTRLQLAHVTSVPFETLAVTGDPYGDGAGRGVSLDLDALYEKIVERRRGGFCYELNGLFGWLLEELGYDVTRIAVAVLTDGTPSPPANHLTAIVWLDREYVVDVGLGVPSLRRPLHLDGEVVRDDADVAWRVCESDRPDADYLVQYRIGDDEWTGRYVFRAVERDLDFVAATCEYLTSAPESPFTGDPVVSIGTEDGWTKLVPDELVRVTEGEESAEPVTAAEWPRLLGEEFGIEYASE